MSDSQIQNESTFDLLFAQSRRLPPAEQKQFIERECHDEVLRKQLLELLESFRDVPTEGFKNSLLPDDVVVQAFENAADELSNSPWKNVATTDSFECGDRIGPYKILERIGEGGMGAVYMAEQTTPVSRRVAIKVVKPEMLSSDALARFEVERQALSMMDHPHIARVLDAGSTDRGQPYFVMELIKGIPITEYCTRNALDTKQRLALFVSVCQAVGHAHQKGVIHRDIKPSNVLVAEYDDEAIPKIIDFGVAKGTEQKLTDRTVFTRFGQLVGTFEYMSPEQAKLNQLDVDTRSDVYSLGVLLYELLTGATPFDRERLRSGAIDEMIRIICEEEPPKPSTRVTTLINSDTMAGKRAADQLALSKSLRGELDWIVMRALEKQRQQRYQSAADFADDVRRYLADEAVEACPPTFVYRAQKFVRKYKTQTIVASAVFISLCVATLLGWSLFKTAESNYEDAILNSQIQERITSLIEKSRAMSEKPLVSIRFAIDAVEQSLQHDGSVTTSEKQALWESIARLDGELVATKGFRTSSISPDGQWLITRAPEGPLLRRIEAASQGQSICLPHANVRRVAFSPNQEWIATASDNKVTVWQFDGLNTGRSGSAFLEVEKNESYGMSNKLKFSGNSRWLVAAYEGGLIQVLDLADNDPIATVRTLNGHENGEHMRAQINHDGSCLVTGDIGEGRVQVWNLNKPDQGPVLKFRNEGLAEMSLGEQGRWLVTRGKSTGVWDLSAEAPEESSFLIRYPYRISSAVVSDDDRRLIVGGSDGACFLYDLTKPHPFESCVKLVGHSSSASSTTSNDHRWLATRDQEGSLRLWDFNNMPSNLLTETHPDGFVANVWAADVNPAGVRDLVGHGSHVDVIFKNEYLYSAEREGMIRRWNVDAKIPSTYVLSDCNDAQEMKVSPDGKWLVVGRRGPRSQVWRLQENQGVSEGFELEGAADGLGTFAMTPDSRWLIGSSATRAYLDQSGYERNENVAYVWDLKSTAPGRIAFCLEGHESSVTAIAVSGSGNRVVTASADMTVRIWELSDDGATQTHLLTEPYRKLDTVATNHDGSVIACGGERGLVYLWTFNGDEVTGRELVRGDYMNYSLEVAVSPDGRWVASASGCGKSFVWDLQAAPGEDCRLVPGHRVDDIIMSGMKFSPNGRWLASSSWFGKTNVFDMQSEAPFAEPVFSVDHIEAARDSEFSADSSALAVCRGSTSVVIDLTEAGSNRPRIREVPYGGLCVALTPNGKRLITSGSAVRVIDLDIENLLRIAKQLAGYNGTAD
ncbi:MAG: protein kinase [Planctomycetales bacterium]|nr:protein kinase [Planctomycetales bacterium]